MILLRDIIQMYYYRCLLIPPGWLWICYFASIHYDWTTDFTRISMVASIFGAIVVILALLLRLINCRFIIIIIIIIHKILFCKRVFWNTQQRFFGEGLFLVHRACASSCISAGKSVNHTRPTVLLLRWSYKLPLFSVVVTSVAISRRSTVCCLTLLSNADICRCCTSFGSTRVKNGHIHTRLLWYTYVIYVLTGRPI